MTMMFLERGRGREVDSGLAAWLGAHAYLRPGELARLRFRLVSLGSGAGAKQAALLLHPHGGSRESKTGEIDKTVVVDDPEIVLGLRRLEGLRDPEALVIGKPANEFWALFQEAVRRLRLHERLGP